MSATFTAPALARLPGRFSFLRRLRKGQRITRIHVSDLSDELRRDLGFADGHISPPRNPLLD